VLEGQTTDQQAKELGKEDGDVALGCLIKDSGDMILLVDRALPFTTA